MKTRLNHQMTHAANSSIISFSMKSKSGCVEPGPVRQKNFRGAWLPVMVLFFMTLTFGVMAQAPTIISFSPSSGAVGTLVTITGTNLGSPTAFTIGGVTAIVVSNSGTTLVGMVMPGAASGVISVTTTAGGPATSVSNFVVTTTPYPSVQQGSALVGTGTGNTGLGSSVAVSADGKTAIVGGPDYNSSQGAVWIYIRSVSGVWTLEADHLQATDNIGDASQGCSVALSADGNTAIVGGHRDNPDPLNPNYGKGAAWIWTRSAGTWTKQSKLVGTDITGLDIAQGVSVSVSADGNTAIVGGPGDNNSTGAAWVFTRNGNTWIQLGDKLVGTGYDASVGGPQQGISVSLSADGKTAIVGGPGDAGGLGAAWVYARGGSAFTQQGSKLAGTGTDYAKQGQSVALSADGNTALVGGPNDDYYTGATWIFTRSGLGVWTQQGDKLAELNPDYDMLQQGLSVSVSADGNTAIVGAPGVTNGDYLAQGVTYVYTRSGSTWTKQVTNLAGTPPSGDEAEGSSVSLSADGSTAVMGAPGAVFPGAAYVFVPLCTSPAISSQSTATQTQAVGGTYSAISVTATGTGIAYQWYSNTSASNSGGTSLDSGNGAQTNSYTPQAATEGTLYYYCVVTGTCGTATSSVSGAFITTGGCANPTNGGTIAAAQTICSGSAPSTFTSSAAASGNTGTLEYKWQLSTTSSSAGFSDIASSNSATYAPGALSANTWYKRLARVTCMADWTGAEASNVLEITVPQTPTTAAAGDDQTGAATCGLTSVTLAANSATIGTGAWSIQSGTGGTVTTPSSPTSTFTGTAGSSYTLRWTISNSPCTASTDDVVITFNQNPTTAAAGDDQTGSSTCGLTSVTLAANSATIGTGAWSIQSGTGGTVTAPSSPTSTFTGTAGSSYTLRWTISNSPCTASTDDVVITFNTKPVALVLSGSTISANPGNNGTITSTTSISGVYYQLYNSSNATIGGAQAGTGSALTWSGLSAGTAYYVIGTNATTSCTSMNSNAIDVVLSPPGNTLAFDGVDDFVNCGNDASLQISTGTIEAWIKTSNGGSGYRGIVVKQWAYSLFIVDNELKVFEWYNGSGGAEYSTGINLADSKWHHIAFSFNTGVTNGSTIYIDGVLKNTITFSSATQSGIQNVGLAIGKGNIVLTEQNYQGSIDEVRVWNTVRTQSQLQSTMYTELAGTESGLVAYYNFNQGVTGGDNTGITTLIDKTSNANNGTLTYFTKTGTVSNFVESYALVVPVPAAATSITGTGFTANWAAPATGTVNSYKLDVSTSSTFGSFVTGYQGLDCGTSLSQAVSGLNAGITYYYRVAADKTSVTGTGGYYRTPTTVTTSCTNPTSGGTIAADQTICSGFAPATFTSSTAASGNTGTLEYKWQLSTTSSSAGFSDIASSNSATYAPGTLTASTWYQRLARVTCMADWTGAVASNVVAVTVNPATAITSQSTATQTQAVGGTYTEISVTAAGTGITYQWYSNATASNSGGTSLDSSNGAQTNSYTPQAATAGTLYYYCVVTGTCGTATSAVSGAFVTAAPSTITSFTPITAGSGATVTITGTNFTGATAVSFGGTTASSFSVVSATSITAIVAGGTTGTISVVTPGGTATSVGTFTYLAPVQVYIGAVLQASYQSLKAAFDKINDGTHKGIITITINGSTTETASAVLYHSGYTPAMAIGSSYSSVSIYPTFSGLSINGNLASPLIDLNGADNVTIDGRVNATGSAKDLVITNTSTSATSETSTIRFINDASSNTVGYCTIKGSSTTVNGGVIYFSTSTGSTGNDNNTINLNDITSAADANRPINAIGSIGSSGKENSGNTISNNNIYDFCNRSTLSYGINLGDYNTAWSITGNSLYETASFVPTASVNYMGINIYSLGGNGFIVSNNFIGGQSSSCGGSAWTKTAATFDNAFTAIRLNVGTGTATSVQGNTIRNFSYANYTSGNWFGIMVEAGDVNIGTTLANTIGAPTGNASINFSTSAIGIFYGIFLITEGTVVVHDNVIGAITTSNTNSGNAINFYGISSRGGGNRTISANTIGSTDAGTSNSIYAASPSTNASQSVNGIYSSGTGTVSISGNIISKLTNGSTNSNILGVGVVKGITTTSGINTISDNTVRDLKNGNANYSTNQNATVTGICQTSTTAGQTISGNTIYNLSNTYDSPSGKVCGLYYSGGTSGTNLVSKNFIYNLSFTNPTTDAIIIGMDCQLGTTTYSNNIISLGISSDIYLVGIYENCAASNNTSFYFNTVYLSGNAGTGTVPTSAFKSDYQTNTKNIRNNIFVNSRTGTTINKHSAIKLGQLTGVTIDYNDYYSPNDGGVIGQSGVNNYTTLATWQTFTSQDLHSQDTNPSFASAGGTLPENYLPTATTLLAATGSGITTDYNETTRSLTSPTMGAFEIDLATTPALQASSIVFSAVGTTGMTIGWTNGDGVKRAVFVKEGSGTITNPTDNTTYTSSADWTSKGTQLGTSGYYCVYNNNSNTVSITGLSHNTQYTVQVFEYNGSAGSEKYNTTTATNNPKAQTSSEAYFFDGTNYYSSLTNVISGITNGSSVTLLLAYSCDANVNISKSFTLDLNGKSIINTGNYTTEIADGTSFNLINTGVGGTFNSLLSFAGSTSTFGLYSEGVLGAGFSVSASSTSTGILQIGDGTTALSHTYTTGDTKFNNKISKILVKNGSGLILNPATDKK